MFWMATSCRYFFQPASSSLDGATSACLASSTGAASSFLQAVKARANEAISIARMVVFMGFLPEWCVVVYVMGCGYSGTYDCADFASRTLRRASSTAAGTKPDTSPPRRAISRASGDAMRL
ncbi:hypothetical protein G6F59_017864 [Rhizopus arrhizus]|nr:hypothetical protein G6F59_017864 [Rhizopus arrhizus]